MTCNILRVRKKTSAEAGVFPKIIPVMPKNIVVEQQAEKGQDLQDKGPDDGSQSKSKSFLSWTVYHIMTYTTIQFKFGVSKIFFYK